MAWRTLFARPWPIWIIFLTALLSHGLFLLNDGVYWDGWLLYTHLTDGDWESIRLWFFESGDPLRAYFHWAMRLFPDLVFGHRLVAFLSILGAAVLVYEIGHRFRFLSRAESVAVALVALLFPAFQVAFEFITLWYLFTYLLFLVAVWCALFAQTASGRRRIALWLIALVAFALSFTTPSLIGYYPGFLCLLVLVYRRQHSAAGWRLLLDWTRRHVWLFLFPVVCYILNRVLAPTSSIFSEYRKIYPSLDLWRNHFQRFLENAVLAQLQLALSPFWAWLAIGGAVFLLLTWLRLNPVSWLDERANRWGMPLFGGALFVLGVAPYCIGNLSPDVHGWTTRHALLVALPVALVLVGLLRFLGSTARPFLPRLGVGVFVMLLLAFGAQMVMNYAFWQARWVKDRALVLQLSKIPEPKSVSVFFVHDKFPIGGEDNYRPYEWASMFKVAWHDESHIGLDDRRWNASYLAGRPPDFNSIYNLATFDPEGCAADLTVTRNLDAGGDRTLMVRYLYYRFLHPDQLDGFLSNVLSFQITPHAGPQGAHCASPPVSMRSSAALVRPAWSAPPASPGLAQAAVNPLRVGWAYEAYPETTTASHLAVFQVMRAAGADALWLGHNNPGEVDPAKVEPGLSYAVYAALQSPTSLLHNAAQAQADGVRRALDAARAAHLQVILPIGYQIQMGAAWNAAHPGDLRRDASGALLDLYHSGHTASPYSTQYRADIRAYYEWVLGEFITPYRGTLAMLSLADEPMGGDYSTPARAAFARRYDHSMDESTSADSWQLGEFQSRVVADYAAWSAAQWQELAPGLPVTISFHGGDTARRVWGLPDLEPLFSTTPANFVVTFDAYLHDDLPHKPANADEADQLQLFLTTLGHLSSVYHKPLALWAGVNAWGLAQGSSSPRDLPDAVTNLALLAALSRRTGGSLWGLFAWNYNVKQQGLYNYSTPTTYDPLHVEIAVNRAFSTVRAAPAATPAPLEVALLISPRSLYAALAAPRAADLPPSWFDAAPYARAFAGRRAAFVTPGPTLDAATGAAAFVITAPADAFEAATLSFLHSRLAEGRVIVGDPSLARALGVPAEPLPRGLADLPNAGGFYTLPPAL